MGSMSIWHWVIVLVVVLLLFGARRIPDLASGLGSGIKNFKKALKEDDEKAVEATATPVQTPTTAEPTANAAKPNEQTKV